MIQQISAASYHQLSARLPSINNITLDNMAKIYYFGCRYPISGWPPQSPPLPGLEQLLFIFTEVKVQTTVTKKLLK